MKHLSLIFVCGLLLIFLSSPLLSQSVTIETVVIPEMTVNEGSETFEITVENISGSAIGSGSVSVDLPTGILYETGSLVNLASGTITFGGTTEEPVFTFDGIASGASLHFSMKQEAVCESIDEQFSGTVFRNEVAVTSGSIAESHTSNAYNILYASLSILSITPKNASVASGGQYTQEVKIINGGNGRLSELEIDLELPVELTLISSNIGTVNDNTITLKSSEISAFGNGDSFLDQDEFVLATITLSGVSCKDKTVTAAYRAGWTGNSGYCQNAETFSNVAIDFADPFLTLSSNATLNTCFGDQTSLQELVIENTGSGVAAEMMLDVFKSSGEAYDQNLMSSFDINSVKYRIGTSGAFIPMSTASSLATRNDGAYSCLGSSPKGQFMVELPVLEPGQKMYVQWDMKTCCPATCDAPKIGGWATEINYSDACSVGALSTDLIGQEPYGASMELFTESDPDITDGEEGTFTYVVSAYENNFSVETGAQFVVNFDIPEGLDFESNNKITWTSSTQVWTAEFINYNATTRQLMATFEVPEPFTISKSEINLKLRANCSSVAAGAKTIGMTIDYQVNPSCTNACAVPMICTEDITTVLRCPSGDCDAGIRFTGFNLERTSFGQPDNDDNGLADASGNLNVANVKTNRIMVGDTLEAEFTGVVHTNATHTSWDYAYAETTFPLGTNLSIVEATVYFTDNSTGIEHVGTTSVSRTDNFTTSIFVADASPATLVSNGFTSFSGLSYEDDDQLRVVVQYQVTGNIGADVIEVTTTNNFYASDIANPTSNVNKYQCNYFLENITFIGYEFSIVQQDYVTFKSCEKVISQTFRLSIGDCCDNFNGGNLFPYEYRNWANIKEAKVELPANYQLLNVDFFNYRTSGTNGSTTERQNGIDFDAQTGNEYYFDLGQYFTSQGGTLNASDDGFTGKLQMTLEANCDVPIKKYQNVNWSFNLDKSSYLDGSAETGWLAVSPDKIRYNPTLVRLSSSNPVEDGISKHVVWNVRYKNPFSGDQIENAFLHFNSPTGDVQITKVVDVSTGVELTIQNDLYLIGSMTNGEVKNFEVYARYSACTPELVYARAGYACNALPEDFASFTCPTSAVALSVEPKPSQLQVQIDGRIIGDVCSPLVEVEIEFASVQLGAVDSIEVVMNIPSSQSVLYLDGSSEKLYPLSGAYESYTDPTLSDNQYSIWLSDIDTQISEEALPGVYFTDKNKMKMRFTLEMQPNFVPGDHVIFNINNERICDEDLPTINVAFDPSIKFERTEIPGLTGVSGDSWSVSWADYNNDGNEDIFVTDYDSSTPNSLYTNNGDGTFTVYNQAPLSTDLASSLASTWGDMDNDGDLDLFVANNLGAYNFLYTNNGDGTFTKVTTGDIATHDGYNHGASWVDYNNDGHLDLFMTDFMTTKHNVLYTNNGDGTFTRNLTADIVLNVAKSLSPSWADIDGDRDQDLFVANYEGVNFLYENLGNGNFELMTSSVVMTREGNSTGSSWADTDNDGDLDLYVTYASNLENEFFLNDGTGGFTKQTNLIATDKGDSHGSTFADFDNDGDQDLFVTNDKNSVNRFYTNMGGNTFIEFETDLAKDLENSFGTATGDIDNDGDADLFIANHSGEANTLYLNQKGGCLSNVCLNLIGLESNASAYGAKVFVTTNIYGQSVTQMKELRAQTGGGAGSQDSRKLQFGLGDATAIDQIRIEWPSGITQILVNQPINDCLTITEQQGSLICGVAYNDENGNCVQDAGEEVIRNQSIKLEEKGIELRTDDNGQYEVYVEDGIYTLTGMSSGNWSQNCGSQTVNVTGSGANAYCGTDFGFSAQCTDPDVQLALGIPAIRRGFSNELIINVANIGGSTMNSGSLELILPDGVTALSADKEWSTYIDHIVTWEITGLEASELEKIILIDTLDLSMQTGDDLTFDLRFTTAEMECDIVNNTLAHTETVVGAIDPNEKHVYPMNNDKGFTSVKQELTYKILFENEGTYFATNVTIIDTLDEGLDLSTLNSMVSAHDFTYELIGRVLKVKFSNILLPTKEEDPKASQGFIQFNIMPTTDIKESYEIKNTAGIIFDFEDAIITNTVSNKMTYLEDLAKVFNVDFSVYPLPIGSEFQVHLSTEDESGELIDRVTIMTLEGKEVFYLDGIDHHNIYIDRDLDLSGLHVMEIHTNTGKIKRRKVIFE